MSCVEHKMIFFTTYILHLILSRQHIFNTIIQLQGNSLKTAVDIYKLLIQQ